MKTSDEYLQEGIAAYKQGRRKEAGRFIKQAIRLNPKNEGAWLWLSGMVETDEQRRDCLRRVLAINPQNKIARRGLQKLSAEKTLEEGPALLKQSPAAAAEIEPTPVVESFTPSPLPALEENQPEPEPAQETETAFTGKEKKRKRLAHPLIFGLIVVVILGALIAVLSMPGISLPEFNVMAAPPIQEVSSEEESAIVNTIYENIAANNAENIDRYMATIHTQSRGFDATREKIEALYRDYDLVATISGVEIIRYSQAEAQVTFILETRKQGGPDFRDNRINGTFILRPEDGQWKLFDQVVSKIQYFEYVE